MRRARALMFCVNACNAWYRTNGSVSCRRAVSRPHLCPPAMHLRLPGRHLLFRRSFLGLTSRRTTSFLPGSKHLRKRNFHTSKARKSAASTRHFTSKDVTVEFRREISKLLQSLMSPLAEMELDPLLWFISSMAHKA